MARVDLSTHSTQAVDHNQVFAAHVTAISRTTSHSTQQVRIDFNDFLDGLRRYKIRGLKITLLAKQD